MKTSSAKAKGLRASKEVKDLLHKHKPELQNDDIVCTSSGQTGEDIKLSPLARSHYPIVIEVKNQEKLAIWSALEQAEGHRNTGNYTPVLFFKRNRSKMYAAIDAEVLVKLLANQKTT